MRSALDPGVADINWTTHEWKEFTEACLADIEAFKECSYNEYRIYVDST